MQMDALALASGNIGEIVLGLDWMSRHNIQWDFVSGQISVGGNWYPLHANPERQTCRRVMLQIDVAIPPKCQVVVPACYQLRGVVEEPRVEWMTEASKTGEG